MSRIRLVATLLNCPKCGEPRDATYKLCNSCYRKAWYQKWYPKVKDRLNEQKRRERRAA